MSEVGPRLRVGAFALAAVGAVAMAALGIRKASIPARCPAGTVATEGRCCAPGQQERDGRCSGAPSGCPDGFARAAEGCRAIERTALIPAGKLVVGPGDWEAQGVVAPRTIEIPSPFRLDVFEVSVEGWNRCVDAGACGPRVDDEPGRPVREVSFTQARDFCHWAHGELPTDDEWTFAAAGSAGRRYPWGDTGAVCVRAAWGVASGPCARASGPDWTGIHPGDSTPEGIRDLAGSVAEWVVGADGSPTVRGGSWRSSFAAELRSWRQRAQDPARGADDIGLRCRYAASSPPAPAVLPSAPP
ncbi:MAG TPA: SUMF1/EgtB/PvdO family nonheme iron enzyme [Polyangiaceae bacterium]|nr:SUMF1/EgtB/PvdO family nonheme iron enzyme [Polyangiaceae bacterium]